MLHRFACGSAANLNSGRNRSSVFSKSFATNSRAGYGVLVLNSGSRRVRITEKDGEMPYLTDDEIRHLVNRAVTRVLKGNPQAANQAAVNEIVGRPNEAGTQRGGSPAHVKAA